MITRILNNKLFKNSFVYIFADIVNKAIPFLLLPVLTHYLTPEDYGLLASFNSLLAVLFIFIGLSTQGSITINFFNYSKKELSVFTGNVIYILTISFIVVLFTLYTVKPYLTHLAKLNFQWFVIAAVIAFFSYFVVINLSLWINEQRPKEYGIYKILETLLKFGLSLYFVIVMALNWHGRVYGMLLGGFISALVSFYLLKKRGYLRFKYNKEYIKDALHFGIPLIPHQLSFWLRHGALIFVLIYLTGKKDTGLYNVAAQLVLPIAVLNDAFNKVWAPYLYKKLAGNINRQEKKNIVKFTYLYFIGINLIALLLIFVAPYIVDWFLDEKYSESITFIVYLAFATAIRGMYLMVVNYIYYYKKTKYLAYITFITSVFTVLLAYWLIKINGPVGAAQALMITSLISFLLVWYVSNRVYKMPWRII